MRKLLTFLIALASIIIAVCSPASAQWGCRSSGRQGGTGCNSVIAGGGGLDAATTAWINAVVAAGGSVSAPRQTLVDTLIKALKSASLFTVMDRIWLYASENAVQAKIDIVNLAVHTLNGTPTFVVDRGYSSATGDFIKTGFIPSTAGGNYSQNSATFGYYDLTSSVAADSATPMGINNLSWIIGNQGGSKFYDVNDGNFPAPIDSQHQGLLVATRTAASGAGAVAMYRNSNSTPLGTDAGASASNPTVEFFVLGSNNAGTVTRSSTDQIAMAFMGGGLTSTQAVNLMNALNAYAAGLPTPINVY